MADLVRDGLVRFIGLSNVSGEQIRRAFTVHAVAAIQVEYSLWPGMPRPILSELPVSWTSEWWHGPHSAQVS